jgi:two-component sensor histidine kinase
MKHILFYLLFYMSLFAQKLPITQMHYLEDTNSSFTIEDIVQKDFAKSSKNNFNLGYHKGAIWFRFDVKNQSECKKFILTLNEHFYEKANLYYKDDGKMTKHSNSLFTPIDQREIKSNKLGFNLTLAKNQTKTLYLELQGKYAYFGHIEIFEKDYFYVKQSYGLNLAFTFVLGVIFVLIFVTFFLYTKTREKIYLYYLGYSFFMFLYTSNITGLLVFLDWQTYIYKFQLSASFAMGFLVLFSKDYLQTKKYLPRFDKVLTPIAILFFVLVILTLYSYQPWYMIVNNSAGIVNILLIILSIIVYFKGHSESKYYTLAMMFYLTFIVLLAFMVNGTIEYSTLTRHGFVLGVVVEMLFFSYLLANRYHLAKESIQNYLEREVATRTSDLKILADERELLLKEVFHRVKNNFHMLIGMLHLEKDKESIDFDGLVNRVKSMSTIHEYLYMNKDLSNIDIQNYLEKLINNIRQSYPQVGIFFECETIPLGFDRALSLGIVINEVVTNSIKHNVKENLHITITLTKEKGTIYLQVIDDGCGFDETTVSMGLGIKLIKQFSKKLPKSESKFSFEKGAKFELKFSNGEKLEK